MVSVHFCQLEHSGQKRLAKILFWKEIQKILQKIVSNCPPPKNVNDNEPSQLWTISTKQTNYPDCLLKFQVFGLNSVKKCLQITSKQLRNWKHFHF